MEFICVSGSLIVLSAEFLKAGGVDHDSDFFFMPFAFAATFLVFSFYIIFSFCGGDLFCDLDPLRKELVFQFLAFTSVRKVLM